MDPDETTYSVGAVSRLTGLSPDVLRAWERRYGAVEPLRTAGGTRRYRARDVERLRLVKAAVDAGHRIGEVARLDMEELERRAAEPAEEARAPLEDVLDALERLDAGEAERLISAQLAALGPTRFARQFAPPLVEAIGERWEDARLCVASEHLGSALLRSLLGSALRPTPAHRHAPIVVFATPPGERHEIGLLVAALTALGSGANPLYLGPDLPVAELIRAVESSGAAALALSIVVLDPAAAGGMLRSLRRGLPASVELWIGGARAREIELPDRCQRVDSLARLEQCVEMLRIRSVAH